MADIFHYYGNDIGQTDSGDIMPASGSEEVKQRILRRLLTNPHDYIWHPDYGAGLPSFIGQNLDIAKITGVVRGQIYLEAGVGKFPIPVIQIQEIIGGITCSIQYTDAVSKQAVTLSFDVTK